MARRSGIGGRSLTKLNVGLAMQDEAYKSLSTPERPVTAALIRSEPRITAQLEALSTALIKQVNVPREVMVEGGQKTIVMDTILPYNIAPNLLQSWPHLLKLSDMPDAQRIANLYESLDLATARILPVEAFCYALSISPMRILEILTGILVRQGAQASTIIAATWHPRVVEKTVEMALRDDGYSDRALLHKATNFTPSPKGSQTIINVQQHQQAVPAAVFVPAPPPEATVRSLADTFNEARGLPALPEFTHAAIDIEPTDDEDEGDE